MSTTINQAPRADKPSRKPRRGWLIGMGVAVLLLLLGGAYSVAYASAGDTVPRNATVGGVAIGGMTREEAIATLEEAYADTETAELELSAGDNTVALNPAEAGLSVDYAATVEQSGVGRSANPAHIWRVLTGGGDNQLVAAVDEPKLTEALEVAAEELDTEAKDATIAYEVPEEGAPEIVTEQGQESVTVDRAASAETVRNAYLTTTEIPLDAAVADPDISDAEVADLQQSWAEPAISDPIEISTDKGDFRVTERAIAKATKFEAKDGLPVGAIDAEELRDQAEPEISENVDLIEPTEATFSFSGGKPVPSAGKDGEDILPDKLVEAVNGVITKSGDERKAEVAIDKAESELTKEEAEKLGVKEVIGEFTTSFPHADYRNANIGRAAEILTGHLIKPGETFSFNDTVGERTEENGFVAGNIISNGRFVMETGGGVSQAVTTLYNAGFYSGLEDVEHWPHTLYIDRYPAGREATVAWGSKDLKIKNDTDYGVVIQGIIDESSPGNRGSITFKMWSTKVSEVKGGEPSKSDFYSEPATTSSASDCQPQGSVEGFTASYWREVYRDGELVRPREQYSWRYAATRAVTCE
ncbi:VanW family protein [Naumannella halotolerans]|uniref:Vancomycin resistance protein YoaR n=1 Tax=Naumannella halotolerans TaxID=993414 RepID=A0A4R7J869_9ACTN|nr:VanW family protein [Naumannella halotolerans]TDT32663.1 vancomycin resistance protein YoaR [Naumannella halotolerans]